MSPPKAESQRSEEDWVLISKINSGDSSAFEILFHRHKNRVFNLALRLTRDAAASEDVVQDVFMRVHAGKAKPSLNAKFTTWLYRVATNLSVDRLRRRRWGELLGRSREPSEDAGALELADPTASARETLEKSETRAIIDRAIQNLPDSLRIPLMLYQFENLPYREIASILGLSQKAIERRLYHAKEKLRTYLKIEFD